MNHRRGSAPINKGSHDSVKGVDPSMGSTPISKGDGDSLKGVDRSMNNHPGSIPINKGCGDSFEGTRPLNESLQEIFCHLQRPR